MNLLLAKYGSLSTQTKATIWFTLCNCITSGITFLAMPFFTRLMSPEQYGIVAVYNSWMAIISVFATLNLSAGAFNNGMAKYPNNRDAFASAMEGLVLVTSLLTFSLVVITYLIWPSAIGLPASMIVPMFFQILARGIFAQWAAHQRYEYAYRPLIASTVAFAVLVTLVSLIAVAVTPLDSLRAFVRVASEACGSTMVAVALVILTQRKKPIFFHLEYWRYSLRFSVPLIPHYLSLIVLGQIDRIMIGDMIGDGAAGIYTVAYMLGTALSIFTSALNSSVVPWQFEKLRIENYDGLALRIDQLVTLVSVVGLIAALCSPELIRIAAPKDYYDAVYVIPPIVAGTLFIFIYNVLSNYEFYFEATYFIAIASSLAAAVNIALNYLMIPRFGYIAAAYTTIACYIFLAAAHSLFSQYVSARKIGRGNARKLFNPKKIWLVAIAATCLILGSMLLFEHLIVRYAIMVALFAILIRYRSVLMIKG